ncbi:preprotein translocase subunit SecA [Flavobacteriales bacterium]|nr:preprotein translocase subunit SecA [Flavobacteriales bacterium]
MGLFDFTTKLFGNKYDKDLKEINPVIDKIKAIYPSIKALSNDDLRQKTELFKKQIKEAKQELENDIKSLTEKAENSEVELQEKEDLYVQIDKLQKEIVSITEKKLEEILPEAFAVVKETASRFSQGNIIVTANDFDKDLAAEYSNIEIRGEQAIFHNKWIAAGNEIEWNMVHYDVQLIGGYVLHTGRIAEMQTGEGKTLSATLPVYLNALAEKGVHLVTVNDYLAKRDCEWMGPIYQFHGLTIDCIDRYQPNSEERRKAYLADITYGTNNEFGFDYLRDNMARRPQDLVQRPHNYAIVDEVDSVLIDDARTPLIISGPTPTGDKHEFGELKHKISSLVDVQKKFINTVLADAKKLINEGNDKEGGFKLLRAYRGLPKNKALIKYLSEDGVKTLLQKTENFYMQDQGKEMPKVDEDLYFVIDEQHNAIELTDKGIDHITSNSDDSNFFIMPDVGAEIAVLEKSNLSEKEKLVKKDELMRDYSIKSERIHSVNQLLKAYTLFEKDVEYVLMDNKVKIVDEQTGRIMDGRRYSDGLHQAIEAKENVKIEAATQTFATITLQNYFRMYNKLSGMTGTAETEAGEFWDIYELDVVVIPTNRPIQRNDKEDKVYKTAREKYNAVIEEIVELSKQGRPILVGTTSVEISELLSRLLKMKKIKHNVLNAKLHQKEADIVAEAGKDGNVTIATNMAGRGTDIKLSDEVKASGGLAIIGTERHDSRRVDRQLRGRAGRQGDPGSSQFFVSLEDNLMRLFGSDRIAKMMDRMGLEEGEVIQHSMITKSIERAQKKIEENNFGIRKRLLEYDDVMNAQRTVIYKKRKHALFGERLALDIDNMIYDTSEAIVNEYQTLQDFEGFKLEIIRFLSVDCPVEESEFKSLKSEELTTKIYQNAITNYKTKSEVISQKTYPVIKDVYENQSATYQNIVIPFTDGLKTLQVVTNLKEAFESEGGNIPLSIEKGVSLAIIDESWKENLRELDDLKQSVQNATYEQKDPLLIYKFESFNLFKQMIEKINKDIVSFLMKANLPEQTSVQQEKQQRQQKLETSREIDNLNSKRKVNKVSNNTRPISVEKETGRNEKVKITDGSEIKEIKWKKAKPLVDSGKWRRI